jgi:hypothetical protein
MAGPGHRKVGGQPIYPAIAVETSLALRLIFHDFMPALYPIIGPRRKSDAMCSTG